MVHTKGILRAAWSHLRWTMRCGIENRLLLIGTNTQQSAANYTLSPSVEVMRCPTGDFRPHFQPLIAGISSPWC